MKPARTSKPRAVTLLEVLVVVAVSAVLVMVLVPALLSVRSRASRISCINNLKQVGLSFRIWAEDNGGKYPMQVSVTNGGTRELVLSGSVFPHFQVLSNELNTPKILCCPDDQGRPHATNFTSDFTDSRIGYFVGVDATPQQPRMLLSGDRQITLNRVLLLPGLHACTANQNLGWPKQIHGNKQSRYTGNIGLVDGSVDQVNAQRLRELLEKSGAATHRLALP